MTNNRFVTRRTSSAQRRRVGLLPGLVDENEAADIEPRLIRLPSDAPPAESGDARRSCQGRHCPSCAPVAPTSRHTEFARQSTAVHNRTDSTYERVPIGGNVSADQALAQIERQARAMRGRRSSPNLESHSHAVENPSPIPINTIVQ